MKPERIYIEERGDGKLQVVARWATHETVLGECPEIMRAWLHDKLTFIAAYDVVCMIEKRNEETEKAKR